MRRTLGNRRALIPFLFTLAAAFGAAFLAYAPAPMVDRGLRFLQSRPGALFSLDNALFLAGIFAVMAMEVAVQGYRRSSIYRLLHPDGSARMDILISIVALCGLFGALTVALSLGLSDLLSDWLIRPVPHGALGLANPVLQVVWFLVAVDFVKYWMHFFQHKIPLWWEGHKFHHSATELNVITTLRGHPADNIFRVLFLAIPMTLMDATAEQFMVLAFLLSVHAGITHSMLPWNFGWVGRWLLTSPVYHRIHHSALPEHADKNLAAIFVIWDRLFGTYYAGPIVNETVGVTDNPYNCNGVLYDLLECPWRMLRTLIPRSWRPPAPATDDDVASTKALSR